MSNIKYKNIFQKNIKYKKKRNIIVKQSYLLLTWLLYNNKSNKNYFIAPNKTKKYTIIKSPMAHKTFSQEQLKWRECCTLINYSLKTNSGINDLNSSIQFVHSQRKNLKYFTTGTNLLLSKKISLRYCFYSTEFFRVF